MDSIETQRRADARYLKAWDEMPAPMRDRITARGIKGPDTGRDPAPDRGRKEVVGREHDITEDLETHAGTEVDFAAACDTLADQIMEQFAPLTPKQAEELAKFMAERADAALKEQGAIFLARIVGFFLLSSDNLTARAHGLAHAARMSRRNGLGSLRDSAKVCNVSHEWMRKVAWKWCELLGLPPLENAKSPEAKKAYSEDKKTNHWRNRKCSKLPSTLPPPNPKKLGLS